MLLHSSLTLSWMGFSSGVRNFCLSIILGWLRRIFLVFQMKYTLQVIMQPAVYSSWNTNIEKAFNIELLVWWKPPTLFRWKKRNSYFYYQRKVTHCFERFYYFSCRNPMCQQVHCMLQILTVLTHSGFNYYFLVLNSAY